MLRVRQRAHHDLAITFTAMSTVAKLYVQRATVKAWRTHPCDAGKDRDVLQFVEGDPADKREPREATRERAPTHERP
jgi:hypothetical protein